MKLPVQLAATAVLAVTIMGCSGSPIERRQAKDDFNYLETDGLTPLVLPNDVKYAQYNNYAIPQGDYKGGTGKEVDIRPPQQVLQLVQGARVEQDSDVTRLWLLQQNERDRLWETMQQWFSDSNTNIRQRTADSIESDWIKWEYADQHQDIYTRHLFSRLERNGRFGVAIELIDWKQDTTQEEGSITERERYNTFMTNVMTLRYDQRLRDEAQAQAQLSAHSIPVNLGTNRSGLPVLMARAEYAIFWQRAGQILPKMGFEIEDWNQSQGRIEVKYSEPDQAFWQEVGVEPFSLSKKSYVFLLGDLGSRTSINLTDGKGKPVTEKQLQELMPVFRHLLAQ